MISIVVVTHNRLDYTKQCLDTLYTNTDIDAQLLVVDSGSTDGTKHYLSSLAPKGNISRVTTTGFEENVGAAVAYNLGFAGAKADIIVRVDNDVLVPAGWASALKTALESDSSLGMLNTELITDLSKEQPSATPGHISYFTEPVWHDAGLGSWCIAMRKCMLLNQIGGYAEAFGKYALQDNDLEKRAQNAGWKLGTLMGLKVGHLYSMDTEDEARFNLWKINEYNRNIKTWQEIWGEA